MPLFNGLMSDLFPGVEPPLVDYGALQKAIEAELGAAGLQVVALPLRHLACSSPSLTQQDAPAVALTPNPYTCSSPNP